MSKKHFVWIAFIFLFIPVFLLGLFFWQISWHSGVYILAVLAVFPVLFFLAVFYYFISACVHGQWEQETEWKEDP